jgi:hypothetical protein
VDDGSLTHSPLTIYWIDLVGGGEHGRQASINQRIYDLDSIGRSAPHLKVCALESAKREASGRSAGIGSSASSPSSFLLLAMRTSSQRQSVQLSLRTLGSRAFDVADRVIIRTLSGVQVASNKFWVTEGQWAVIEL